MQPRLRSGVKWRGRTQASGSFRSSRGIANRNYRAYPRSRCLPHKEHMSLLPEILDLFVVLWFTVSSGPRKNCGEVTRTVSVSNTTVRKSALPNSSGPNIFLGCSLGLLVAALGLAAGPSDTPEFASWVFPSYLLLLGWHAGASVSCIQTGQLEREATAVLGVPPLPSRCIKRCR